MKIYKTIVKKLIKKNYTLSIVESCTGGQLSSAITSVSGSSKIFDLGIVSYSNQAKIKIIKIKPLLLKRYGAVSSKVCTAMLSGLSKLSRSKIKIAITGIAGPKGGTKKKPVGLVYVGIKINNKISIFKHNFKNLGRHYIQKQTIKKTMIMLNKLI